MLNCSACIQVQTRSTPPFSLINEQGHNSADRPGNASLAKDKTVELKILENKIKGQHELAQYGKALPYFKDLDERIEFLSLDSFKKRTEWLKQKRFWDRVSEHQKKFDSIIKSQDIALGMTPDLLRQSWGNPVQVFVSGMIEFGNYKWVYQKQQPNHSGYQSQKIVVYFESGVIAGWEGF